MLLAGTPLLSTYPVRGSVVSWAAAAQRTRQAVLPRARCSSGRVLRPDVIPLWVASPCREGHSNTIGLRTHAASEARTGFRAER
jgi:hypothetical protein